MIKDIPVKCATPLKLHHSPSAGKQKINFKNNNARSKQHKRIF